MVEDHEAKVREKEAAMRELRTRDSAATGAVDGEQDSSQLFVAYVPLPEQKEIEMRVMAKKKEELLSKYASDALIQQQEEAKQMLNVQD